MQWQRTATRDGIRIGKMQPFTRTGRERRAHVRRVARHLRGDLRRLVVTVTRRKCLALLGLPITLNAVTAEAAPSVHVQGILRAENEGAGEGYYALCGEHACHAIEALGISVHPKNALLADDLALMANQRVQVSIFPVKA